MEPTAFPEVRKYRKRPVVVEAYRWEPDKPFNIGYMAGWLNLHGADFFVNDQKQINIKTLEGVMLAIPGDYIIRGVEGEFYPCKAHIFHSTYEHVTDKDIELGR